MNDEFGVGIWGFGSYLPPKIRDNSFWPADFNDKSTRRRDFLAVEQDSAGKAAEVPPETAAAIADIGDDPFFRARERHVLDDEAEVSDMEAEACRRAMAAAGVRPEEIDLLLLHSLVPDRVLPSNAPAVQAKCGLSNAAAWSLDVSCASFQPQLVTAAAMIRSGTYNRILMVDSQAASRVADYALPGSTALGDAAAAVVIGRVPKGSGLLGHWIRTDGALRDALVFAGMHEGRPTTRWDRYGGPMQFASLDLNVGKQSGLRAATFCKEASLNALAAAQLSIDDVALYVGNQSVGWLVDACRRGLGLPPEKTIDTFPEVANIGGVAIPFNLERAYSTGRLHDGDIVLMYSPGAGLTRAAVVYRWISPNVRQT